MTPSCALLSLAAALCPAPAPPVPTPALAAAVPLAPAPDAWVGEDKLQHLGLSFAATAMSYGAARFALDADAARIAAGATAAALGVGKEILDRRRGGGFSIRDLVWDSAGVALGLALIGSIP